MHSALRVRSSQVSGGRPVSTLDHGDALVDRADERAEIAADAFGFVDARNAGQAAWDTGPCAGRFAFLARDRSFCNGCAASCFVGCRNGVQLYVAIDGAGDAVEMDALMRAIPAGDVAEVAADALLLVDVRDDFVVQVEVLPLGDAVASDRPRKSSMVAKPFVRIQLSRPSAMSSTMR